MNNVKISNICKTELILGIQLEKSQTEYTLGKTLTAASNIGDKPNQEDSVLILQHPQNENIKLLAVADGVGGSLYGEKASSYLLQEIAMHFDVLPEKYYNDAEFIETYFNKMIKHINKEIVNKNFGQTTLSMSIIANKKTIIFNIGDSRTYTITEGKLKQETEDDSVVQELYKMGEIPKKDMMRYHNNSNLITNSIGMSNVKISSKIIPNKYNTILGVTDGVSDFLSDEEIESIINNNKKENISKELVEQALERILIGNYGEGYQKMRTKHDNTSAVSLKIR